MPDVSLQTILVAVIAGLGGGLAGTWLQIRHGREEAFRERLINAADDLATGLQQAIIGMGNTYSTVLEHSVLDPQGQMTTVTAAGGMPAEIKEALKRSRELIGEARARMARVALLYGPVSAPDRSATLAVIHPENALDALDPWPPVPDLPKYREEMSGARSYLDDFNRAALSDAKGRPWWRRWRSALWVRRKVRRLRLRSSQAETPSE